MMLVFFYLPSRSGGRAHGGADLRDLLLLSQDQEEGSGHLSKENILGKKKLQKQAE